MFSKLKLSKFIFSLCMEIALSVQHYRTDILPISVRQTHNCLISRSRPRVFFFLAPYVRVTDRLLESVLTKIVNVQFTFPEYIAAFSDPGPLLIHHKFVSSILPG